MAPTMLLGGIPAADAIVPTAIPRLSDRPGVGRSRGAEIELVSAEQQDRLAEALAYRRPV